MNDDAAPVDRSSARKLTEEMYGGYRFLARINYCASKGWTRLWKGNASAQGEGVVLMLKCEAQFTPDKPRIIRRRLECHDFTGGSASEAARLTSGAARCPLSMHISGWCAALRGRTDAAMLSRYFGS